jgi:hypothetical protein
MNITCREYKELDLTLRMSQAETDALITVLYQATSDLVLDNEQIKVANSLLGALRGDKRGSLYRVDPA